MIIVPAIKEAWHADIARDPEVHGWVLNLYMLGERYPKTVDDYFPSRFAPTPELASLLDQHRADEHKHELLFARALQAMGQPFLDLPPEDVYNHSVRSFTPVSFAIADSDGPEERRRKLAHFMAHAHFLESRIERSLLYHIDACLAAGKDSVARAVEVVWTDEARHATYTRETVFELVGSARAREILDLHKRAEARANLSFSSRQVAAYVRRFGQAGPRHKRWLYRFCGALMKEAAAHV